MPPLHSSIHRVPRLWRIETEWYSIFKLRMPWPISFTIFLIWIYTVVWRLSELSRLSLRGYSEWNYKVPRWFQPFFNRDYPQHHFLQREVVASLFIPRLSQRPISSTICGLKIHRSYTLIPDFERKKKW